MKRFKVQKTMLCEVRVWGWITADNMFDAMTKGLQVGTDRADFNHEVTSDIKTTSIQIAEEV